MLIKSVKYQVKREWVDVFECAYQHMSSKDIYNKIINNWLFYASYSPLWKERIEEYHGIIDEDNEKVHFENDDYKDYRSSKDIEFGILSKLIMDKCNY